MDSGRLIMEINIVQNNISDNFYSDYKAVRFDYEAVFYFRLKYKINSWFFSFLQNLSDFSLFQKNMKVYLNSIKKELSFSIKKSLKFIMIIEIFI